MTDIAEIHLKIKAVEIVLKSFSRIKDEQQRRDYLKSQLDNVPNLDTYCGFSEDKLQDFLNKLQENANLLLAQHQGRIYYWFQFFI